IKVNFRDGHVVGMGYAADGENAGKAPRPPLNRESVSKIRLDMTEKDVLDILGEPEGTESPHSWATIFPGAPDLDVEVDQWKDGPLQVSVCLQNKRVVKVQYGSETLAEKK